MAEFAEVMRQAKRMCDNYGCGECPLYNGGVCRLDTDHDGEDYSDVERIIMAWAEEHPETIDLDWNDVLYILFHGSADPCHEPYCYEDCTKDMKCSECIERSMTKKVDGKLWIKPITTGKAVPEHDGCEGCRWIDKNIDEDPCKNCCIGWRRL